MLSIPTDETFSVLRSLLSAMKFFLTSKIMSTAYSCETSTVNIQGECESSSPLLLILLPDSVLGRS